MTDTHNSRFLGEEYLDIIRQSLDFFVTRIKQNIATYLLIIFAFCIAGVAYWYTRKPYYESELVCACTNERMPRKAFGEMAQKLNVLAKNGSSKELSRLLNITEDQATAIISVEARNRAGSPLYEDITMEFQPLYFKLSAKNRDVFLPLQTALVHYLNTSPYDSTLRALQTKTKAQLIAFMSADLLKLDSVIDDYRYAIRIGNTTVDSAKHRSSIADIFQFRHWLQKQLGQQQERYAMESAPTVTVMHGFAPADRPTRGSKKSILAFSLIGLLLATGIVVVKK
jgi:hypothetical protein